MFKLAELLPEAPRIHTDLLVKLYCTADKAKYIR